MRTIQKTGVDSIVPRQDVTSTSNPSNIKRQIRFLKDGSYFNQNLASGDRPSRLHRSSLIIMLFFMLASISRESSLSAQSIGLQVVTEQNVLFGDTIAGSGKKLIWDSFKGALRAGFVETPSTTVWDKSNIGSYSSAFGRNNLASQFGSMSWGDKNQATEYASTAFGQENIASGMRATAWGQQDTASHRNTTAWGSGNHASSFESTAWGQDNRSSGTTATAWGIRNQALGLATVAWGMENIASGSRASVWGLNNEAMGELATVWGRENMAIGDYSSAWGRSNKASNSYSTALGEDNVSNGLWSMVWGRNNVSDKANSTAWGEYNIADGNESTVWGGYNKSQSAYETVIGRYADTVVGASNSIWWGDDQLFAIGNGTDDTSRHNAVTVFKNGVVVFSPEDVAQDIVMAKFQNGSFNEPIIRPSLTNWGFLGEEDHYFAKTYSNSFFAGATANYQTFSDKRLKREITDLGDGLSVIQALHPVNYKLIKTENKTVDNFKHYGLIAQDVEKVLPEIVHTHPSGMKSVGYQALIPFLIKGMQEQQETINELKKANNQYEGNLSKYQISHAELIDKIQQLEKQIDRINMVINK